MRDFFSGQFFFLPRESERACTMPSQANLTNGDTYEYVIMDVVKHIIACCRSMCTLATKMHKMCVRIVASI